MAMRRIGMALLMAGWFALSSQAASAAEQPAALMNDGKIALAFRYRYEFVDDDNFPEEAKASTLRSRLSLQSGSYRDFSFFLEADDIREIGSDDFNAGAGNTPSRTMYPVVADPEGTEVNQAYADYRGFAGTLVRLGRQRINLDNQRFVGGVGWRQNEQTFDAVSVDWSDERSRVFYAAVDNVNRIYGEDVPDGDHRQDPTHLLNLSTEVAGIGRLSAYHYAIDNEDVLTLSTRTTGVRLAGKANPSGAKPSGVAVTYQVEYAQQSDSADNPRSIDADYWHLGAGVGAGILEVSAGWEVLGGDADEPGQAFRTPLATLHAFNGWADMFLTTPDAGLDDRYLALKATHEGWVAEVRAHRFEAEEGGAEFGDETDLRVGYRFGPHLQLDLFAAAFNGVEGYQDVTKAWLMVTAEF